ncbi:hypothetical protein ACWDYH_36275 [Nocardia goodfellowii]
MTAMVGSPAYRALSRPVLDRPEPVIAQAIAHRDRSGTELDAHIQGLYALAAEARFELAGGKVLVVDSDHDLARLLAMLPLDDVSAILIPHLTCLGAWLDVLRADYEVWTLEPRRRWSRQPSGRRSLTSGPGR